MRSPREIRAILEMGETSSVEFKMIFSKNDTLKAVTAFTNDLAEQGGGLLLIGIHPKTKQATGVEDLDNLQQIIANNCRDAINPPVSPVIYIAELEKPILVVEAQSGDRTPYRFNNDCYVRVGSTTRKATFEDELHLYQRSAQATTEEVIPGDLPPREDVFCEFVGRNAELEYLWGWVRDPNRKRHSLAGEGGVGKTAIAYELASKIKNSGLKPFEHVIWMSAKKMEFTGGTTVTRNTVDFWDLSSALDKMLSSLGFEFANRTVDQKVDDLLSIVDGPPIFVVVDDIDTLPPEAQDGREFLTFRLPSAGAKVLATTRMELYGLPCTRVSGFEAHEGLEFIRSRLIDCGIFPNTLSRQQMESIVQTATGNPLYIEDLLRLALNLGDTAEAVNLWKDHGAGDEARNYALRREFEMLSGDAKLLMLAASVAQQPLTGKELGMLANLSTKRTNDALDDLQNRFFISRPSLIEGMPRFDLNANTRRLVVDLSEKSDQLTNDLKRVRGAYTAMFGDVYSNRSRQSVVSGIVEQAVAWVRVENTLEAERVVEDGLTRFPEDPDLHGIAGYVFKKSTPRRTTDARERFRRASQLKSRNPRMYQHWVDLEVEDRSLDGELEASAAWTKAFPQDPRAAFAYGTAQTRVGQRLLGELQHNRGMQMLRDAERSLSAALVPLEKVRTGEYGLHGKVHRAMVLNAAALYGSLQDSHWLDALASRLETWRAEHPTDPAVAIERDRLRRRFPQATLPA